MDVIELECPHCGDELELDAAFAGSVCRCSTCGTLMTVPADPKQERSEKIARRDRPDAPDADSVPTSSNAVTPAGATGRAESPIMPAAGGRPDTPSARPDFPGDQPTAERPESPVEALPAEEDVFVTDTGKAVQLHGKVPTARKRKKQAIRTTVIAVFVGLTLMLVVIIILAMNLLFGDKKPKTTDTPEIVGIDPNKNPITDAAADILSVPIGKECAIIVDGTGFSRAWFPILSEIIAREVALAPGTEFLVIVYTDIGPMTFPGDKPAKIEKLADLERFLSRITTVNDGSVVAAAQKALDARADQLLIVAGRALEAKELSDLTAAVSKRVDTQVDAVLIEADDAALGDFAKANKGQYVRLKSDLLKQWYDAWKKGPEEPAK